MDSPTVVAAAGEEPASVADRGPDEDRATPLEVVVIAYAIWTVSFLVGLWVGVGWALALPLTLALGAATIVALRRPSAAAGRPFRPALARGSGVGWVLAGVLLAGWVVVPLGSGARFALAGVTVVLLLVVDRGAVPDPGGLVPAGALFLSVALGAAAAAAHAWSWTAFTAVLAVAAIGAAAACLRDRSTPAPDAASGWATEWSVLAVGASFWAWTAFTRQFNPDDSYYANKAAHYAADASDFEVVNQLFGLPDEPHVPLADVLSAWEPLAGMVAGITGVHHATILYVLLAPLAAGLIPSANRYAARALGARRPEIVALVAAAAMLHLEFFGDAQLLGDKIFQGKGVLVLVALPVVIGSAARYWQNPTTLRLVVAVAAAIAALGLTPTAGAPVFGGGLALFVAGLVTVRTQPSFTNAQRALGAVPLVVATAFTLFAFWFQSRASQTDPTFIRFAGPENAWARRLVSPRTDAVIDWNIAGILVVFSLVVVMIAGRTAMQRAFFTLVGLGLFLLLFNPLFFTPLFDEVLHLNFLAWRFGWILPVSLVIGLSVDAFDRPLPVVGHRLGVAIVGLVVVAGLPLAARTDQEFPAPWDLQNRWIVASDLIVEATPPGGRYLAPERVEIATTALSSDIFPAYARQRLLGSYGRSMSDAFEVELRDELARQVKGARPTIDPIQALDALRIDTVCTDPRIDDEGYALLEAMPQKFESGEQVRFCLLWRRVVPVDG